MRAVNALRQFADIELFGGDTSEDELFGKLESKHFDLVLAPWYRYLAWSKIEGAYGLSRTSGPTFVGYFGDQLLPYEIGAQADHSRMILVDLARLTTTDAVLILKSLLRDTTRSGLRPLLQPTTMLHCENWMSGQGIGFRVDTISTLDEVKNTLWIERLNAIRVCHMAMWSLVFDDGPKKAWFQLGADAQAFAMRICFSMPSKKTKDILQEFWPDQGSPSHAGQFLLKHADFLRVHFDPDTSEMEVVIALFPSAPAEKAATELHTFWIEPLAGHTVQEKPYAVLNHEQPLLKPLVTHHELIAGAAEKVEELRKSLTERDCTIRELRSGGVGTAAPLTPPDAETLLEAFRERYFESRYKIRQFQLQIEKLSHDKTKAAEMGQMHREMKDLANRQKKWIASLSDALEGLREAKQSTKR